MATAVINTVYPNPALLAPTTIPVAEPSKPEPIVDADAELIPLAKMGDQQAFTELVNRHYPACLKLARSILRDHEDAEDEVQNACTKAFLHLGSFEGNSRFSTWLSRIVVNQCLMRLRQLRRAQFTYLDDPGADENQTRFELRDTSEDPEQRYGRNEVASLLYQEVNRIPPLLRKPLLLRESMRLPLADVARQLDISEAAAKSRLLRARRELRERLGKHQGRRGTATLLS
ncbi:MAG: sigma-70 family RNA polymerase sigma factor [Acidobacteria bacterium]|nr:sigma-70 family RNA polymerase sigma factor [Acidobacteriota bacterium]